MTTKHYLLSTDPQNTFFSLKLNTSGVIDSVADANDLINKAITSRSGLYQTIPKQFPANECVGFTCDKKDPNKISIVSPTMEKNLKNAKYKNMTVIAIIENAKKPGTREGYIVANDIGVINVISIPYVKKAKKDGYIFTNMSAEKGFLVAFDGIDVPIIKLNMEEKKKTFKFYGFDTVTQSMIKLNKKDCEASVILNNKNISFNILDETQKLNKKPDSLFFKDIKKVDDYICVELIDNVAKVDSQLDNISYFVGGLGLDEANALKLIKANLNIKITDDKPVITTDYNRMSTYQLCLAYKARCEEIAKTKKKVKEATEILKQVCINGEVFTKGNKRVAVLLGTEEGNRKFDGKAFMAAFPNDYSQYRKFGERKDDILIDDGSKLPRTIDKDAEKDEDGKKIYKRENFTDDQLFTLAFGLNETKEMLTTNEYKKLDMEDALGFKLSKETATSENKLTGKLPGNVKTYTISDCGNKLLVSVKHYDNGAEGWDLDRLKFEGLYEQYCTRNKDSIFLTVLNII